MHRKFINVVVGLLIQWTPVIQNRQDSRSNDVEIVNSARPKTVIFPNLCVRVKSLAELNKRLNSPKCRGNGKTSATFYAFPVIVGKNGAGSKKRLESRLMVTV